VKKKSKAKAKSKRNSQPLVVRTPADIQTALGSMKLRPGQLIPAQAASNLVAVKRCVESYEQNTGAKANQTRLIDFVRWCEDNSGLL